MTRQQLLNEVEHDIMRKPNSINILYHSPVWRSVSGSVAGYKGTFDAFFPNLKVPELQKFSKGRDIQMSVNGKRAEKGDANQHLHPHERHHLLCYIHLAALQCLPS